MGHFQSCCSHPRQQSPKTMGQLKLQRTTMLKSNTVNVETQLAIEPSEEVFTDDQLRPMSGDAMQIQPQPDAKAFRITTTRQVPYAHRDQVTAQLDDMVASQIIQPVSEPTEWCHPIAIVPKKSTSEICLTVDLSKLNKRVSIPVHPMCSTRDAVANLDQSRYFTKLDAQNGYWHHHHQPSLKMLIKLAIHVPVAVALIVLNPGVWTFPLRQDSLTSSFAQVFLFCWILFFPATSPWVTLLFFSFLLLKMENTSSAFFSWLHLWGWHSYNYNFIYCIFYLRRGVLCMI